MEIKGHDPVLLVSAYMPCKGLQDSTENYEDCLAQLSEIVAKFSSSHRIVIGGDFNEDMVDTKKTKRSRLLSDFLNENKLYFSSSGKTYVNPDGLETSTINYIFYDQKMREMHLSTNRLLAIHANVSDHIPVLSTFKLDLQHIQEPVKTFTTANKVRWDKINKEKYEQEVNSRISVLRQDITSKGALDVRVQKFNEILVQAAQEVNPKPVKRHRKARLKVWTPEIQDALRAKKQAFYEWKQNNKPNQKDNLLVINKKLTTGHLRKLCRIESARIREAARQEILDTRYTDSKLFYKLIDKQRGKLKFCVNELSVGEVTYNSASGVLTGWKEHFSKLATPDNNLKTDVSYQQLIGIEMPEIIDICNHIAGSSSTAQTITVQQVKRAVESLNRGKAADIYGVVAEHILFGGDLLLQVLTEIVNSVFSIGSISDSLKAGVLTPVYKRKGLSTDAKNYRGITILPVITKFLETVIKNQIQPIIEHHQSKLQRGFTRNASPMNCSLILEEAMCEHRDVQGIS